MGQKKNQWHPAFAAAMRMELKDNVEDLIFEEEHLLSKKPLQMDMLIIKNDRNVDIANRIGKIFRKYNVIEYKSPQDAMGIDAFYKVMGYASLYKVSDEKANGFKADDITIALVRQRYPRKLMNYLQEKGCVICKVYPGIYYVTGNVLFTLQIIVSKDLGKKENIWLHSLQNSITKQTYHDLLDSIEQLDEKQRELYGEAVLQVVTVANKEKIEKWKEETKMCETLAEIMAPEIEASKEIARVEGHAEGRAVGLEEGRAEGRAEGQVLAYADVGLSVGQIADKVGISEEVKRVIDEN